MHHTKDKGDIGTLKIMCDLAMQGYKILTPHSEHLPFDIAIFNPEDGKIYKVQCKHRKVSSKGVVNIQLRTTYLSSAGNVSKRYNGGDFDVIAVYCPDIDKCAYITESKCSHLNHCMTLRINHPKEGVCKKRSVEIHNFMDYLKLEL